MNLQCRHRVLAYNEATGETGFFPVLAVWAHTDPLIVELTIDGETIETTLEHPFYTADGTWVAAGDLQPGDELRNAAWHTGTVEQVFVTYRPQPMYNFTVAAAHTYFVGDARWLVHNSCGDVAFGLRRTVHKFASGVNAGTYWDFYDDTVDMNKLGTNLLDLMSNADHIHFDLTGFSGSWQDIARYGSEGIGQGNVANWEFYQIVSNPDLFRKTTFYLDGQVYRGVRQMP